ncbi:MAG: PD40 domain-containing protein [Elusimicrobia bacterium]|jgi:TolB protein|nr:PD40 domain-containing protein [Elusimicrobiota bacterium]
MKFLLHIPMLFLAVPLMADSLYLELSATGDKIDLGLASIKTDRSLLDSPDQAAEIFRVVKNDLGFTGLFRLMEGGPSSGAPKLTEGWSRLGADVVSVGSVEKALLGRRQFAVELRDANTGRTVLAKKFLLDEGARRAAHRWADEIVLYFTGQSGIASSRVVFVNDTTGSKEVCIVDADGANFQRLTNDRVISLFPKLSPDGEWIIFTSFREGRPAIYKMRSDGRDKTALCRYDGLNSAAAWMPDGKSIVATLSDGRSPNLSQVDLDGRVIQVLTNSSAVDTAPTVSPDGLRVAFTSDRPGSPQIYFMDASGANIRRGTSGPQADSPHWSPLGHLLVFTQLEKKYFDLWTLEVATGKLSRLTYGEGDNENASWSPDGRHVVFSSTRRGRPELWVMGADGSSPRPLGPIPGRSFTPHWGQ